MKWLLQNARQRATFAMKNPRYALGAMLRELTLADEKFLAKITGASVEAIRLDEPITSPAFARRGAEIPRAGDLQRGPLREESFVSLCGCTDIEAGMRCGDEHREWRLVGVHSAGAASKPAREALFDWAA